MPQASLELREWARSRFGTIDDAPVIEFLKSKGYRHTSKWNWVPPENTLETATDDVLKAATFLADEWDWGWFVVESHLLPGEVILS